MTRKKRLFSGELVPVAHDFTSMIDIMWYISGPMTGYPNFNFPAFDEASRILRAYGLQIISPAELDRDDPPAPGSVWMDFILRDLKVIHDKVKGIIFLPNWYHSRGARMEAFTGIMLGMRFAQYYDDTETAHPIEKKVVAEHLKDKLDCDASY
jgi:hypothetical protein